MGRTRRRRRQNANKQKFDSAFYSAYLTLQCQLGKVTNLSYLKLNQDEKSGNGLYAAKNIDAGQVILFIPPEKLIEPNWLKENRPSYPSSLGSTSTLALFLAHEKAKLQAKHSSIFKAYIKTLPLDVDYVSMPLYSKINFNDIKFSCFKSHYEIQMRKFQSHVDEIKEPLLGILSLEKLNIDESELSLLCQWAVTGVWTRSVYINEVGEVLVPFFDLLNHCSRKTNTAVHHSKDGLLLKSKTKIRKNEQVLICYHSNMANRDFYLHYGFHEIQTRNDLTRICPNRFDQIPVETFAHTLFPTGYLALASFGLTESSKLCLQWPSELVTLDQWYIAPDKLKPKFDFQITISEQFYYLDLLIQHAVCKNQYSSDQLKRLITNGAQLLQSNIDKVNYHHQWIKFIVHVIHQGYDASLFDGCRSFDLLCQRLHHAIHIPMLKTLLANELAMLRFWLHFHQCSIQTLTCEHSTKQQS